MDCSSPKPFMPKSCENIERAAYSLWKRRGCPPDSPDVNWLPAEQECPGSHQNNDCLTKAFCTALLLTGSVKRAEAVLLEAIQSWNCEYDLSEQLLLNRTLICVYAGVRHALPSAEETAEVAALLPAELAVLLRLPSHLRELLILRVLVGLPREFCGRLRDLTPSEVDSGLCLAMQCLSDTVQTLVCLGCLAESLGSKHHATR